LCEEPPLEPKLLLPELKLWLPELKLCPLELEPKLPELCEDDE
jgi:hypothetical protein